MKPYKRARFISQIIFFVLIALVTLNHALSESGMSLPLIGTSSLHAICPFGGVETLVAWASLGVYVPKIHPSSMVLLAIILLLSFLLGPVVCSYACPLGSVQEWVGNAGKRLLGRRYNTIVPRKLDKALRYARYLVLIFVVYLTTNSLKLIFLEVDPYYALFHFWSSEATLGGIAVLVLVLMGSLFVERPWCKYACPFGAVVGLTNVFSVFKIKRNADTCVQCDKCSQVCPMNIDVSKKSVIRDHQCIRCGLCTSEQACPIENTVEMKFGNFESRENHETE